MIGLLNLCQRSLPYASYDTPATCDRKRFCQCVRPVNGILPEISEGLAILESPKFGSNLFQICANTCVPIGC